jgi:hypothetical protein
LIHLDTRKRDGCSNAKRGVVDRKLEEQSIVDLANYDSLTGRLVIPESGWIGLVKSRTIFALQRDGYTSPTCHPHLEHVHPKTTEKLTPASAQPSALPRQHADQWYDSSQCEAKRSPPRRPAIHSSASALKSLSGARRSSCVALGVAEHSIWSGSKEILGGKS